MLSQNRKYRVEGQRPSRLQENITNMYITSSKTKKKKKQIKSVASNLLKLVLSNTVQQIFIYLKEKLPHPVHIINLILINLLSVCVK